MKKHLTAAALAAALLPAFAACSTENADDPASSSSPTRTAGESSEQAGALSVTDPWVKAATDGMTAAFGTLVNDSDEDITVVSASTEVNAMTELHETIENEDGSMAMQPKEGGFVVPAGGTLELAPGGNHIMLMELSGAVEPGTTVTITLTLGDGSTATVEATVKPFDGADEKYQDESGDDGGEMGGMDHSSDGTDGTDGAAEQGGES